MKQSFISNLIGNNNYEECSPYAIIIIVVGTSLQLIFGGLSFFFHIGIINWFLQLITGTSLLFVVYIGALILALDKRVEVDEPERFAWNTPRNTPKPRRYKLTILWGLFLVLMGVLAIYFSNKYRRHYAFECETFLVDTSNGIYHLNYDECEVAESANDLIEMKGYEIKDEYHFCEWCEEWLDDAEDSLEPNN